MPVLSWSQDYQMAGCTEWMDLYRWQFWENKIEKQERDKKKSNKHS